LTCSHRRTDIVITVRRRLETDRWAEGCDSDQRNRMERLTDTNTRTDRERHSNTRTNPASSVVKMCLLIRMCSTVGDRVPIWRRSKLLKICATSFRPYEIPSTSRRTWFTHRVLTFYVLLDIRYVISDTFFPEVIVSLSNSSIAVQLQ